MDSILNKFLRKENVMNHQQPCIAIDVSKGNSHVCGFTKAGYPYQKVLKITHNQKGFETLSELYHMINRDTQQVPVFIFEATGIYHRPLKNFLETRHYPFIEASPLLAAKHRKNSTIRSAKTDARDTQALARLFYDVDFQLNRISDETFYELRQCHRYYTQLTEILVKCKVHFNEKLDILFPEFRNEVTQSVYANYYLELLKKYPHPDLLAKARVDTIQNLLVKHGKRASSSRKNAEHLKEFSQKCWSGSSPTSVDTMILVNYIEQIQQYQQQRDNVIKQMISLGKDYQLYQQLQSIPGIGRTIAICLIAELGDLSNFDSRKQLLAYAGLDPVISQSGQRDGKGLSISKKGNKHLRRLLFLVVTSSVHISQDHPIQQFYQKKRQNLPNKAALIASSDKLLRTIFRMSQTGENYLF